MARTTKHRHDTAHVGLVPTGQLASGTPTSGMVPVYSGTLNAAWAYGSGVEITDGTHDITGATKLTITGGVVGGSTPNATLAVMANPMTTQDDIIVQGASAAGRLGKGTDGQVLTVDPTTHHLIWATPSASGSPLTTKGDLFGHSTVDARIPVGTDAYVLTADSTQALGVKWAASASGFADPTTTKGDLIVHGSVTERLGVGANGQVLTADSTQTDGIKWATPTSGGASNSEDAASVLVNGGLGYSTHFPGTSLPSGWATEVASPSADAVANSAYGGNPGGSIYHLMRSFVPGSSAFRIEARMLAWGSSNPQLLSKDNTTSDSTFASVGVDWYGGSCRMWAHAGGSWTMVGSGIPMPGSWFYVRLDCDGAGNFAGFCSADRALWLPFGSTTNAFTIAKVGFRISGGIVSVDFFDTVI